MKIQEITKSFPYCDLLKNTFFFIEDAANYSPLHIDFYSKTFKMKMQQTTIPLPHCDLLQNEDIKLQYHFLTVINSKKKNPMKIQQTTISFPSCYLLTKRFFYDFVYR